MPPSPRAPRRATRPAAAPPAAPVKVRRPLAPLEDPTTPLPRAVRARAAAEATGRGASVPVGVEKVAEKPARTASDPTAGGKPPRTASSAVGGGKPARTASVPVSSERPVRRASAPVGTVQPRAAAETAAPAKASPTVHAPRRRRMSLRLLSGVAAALLGIGLVSQIHSAQARGLESLSQTELLDMLGQVNNRSDRLGGEIQRLEGEKRELTGGNRDQAAVDSAQQRLDDLRILAGTAKAHGPGIVIQVDDPQRTLRAGQFITLVSELRDAGAEAIQVGTVRVVASTWFEDAPGGQIVADGGALSSPVVIRAVGDPHTLSRAMKIPGGAEHSLGQAGRTVSIQEQPDVLIDALHTPAEPRYARAVGSSPSSR